jgi:hypothetical protein
MKQSTFIFSLLFILTKLSFSQHDSIKTILLERVNNKGKIITKTVVPKKIFYIKKTEPKKEKISALSLEYIGYSSIIITKKIFVSKSSSANSLNQSQSSYYYTYDTIVCDTVPFKDISYLYAKTKKYNIRTFLGVTALVMSYCIFTIGLDLEFLPDLPTYSRIIGINSMVIGVGVFFGSIKLIKMRRFNTKDKWKIKSGYYLK